MSSSLERTNCPICNKDILKSSLRKHRIAIHGEHIPPAKIQEKKVGLQAIPIIIPFENVPEKDPIRILLSKLEGCKRDFNGTKSAMQLYFSYEEHDLLLTCVKDCLTKKNEQLTQVASVKLS